MKIGTEVAIIGEIEHSGEFGNIVQMKGDRAEVKLLEGQIKLFVKLSDLEEISQPQRNDDVQLQQTNVLLDKNAKAKFRAEQLVAMLFDITLVEKEKQRIEKLIAQTKDRLSILSQQRKDCDKIVPTMLRTALGVARLPLCDDAAVLELSKRMPGCQDYKKR